MMNNEEQDTCTIVWHIEDILSVRPDLSNEQARKLLRQLKNNHDASIGINWDVIDIYAETAFPIVEEAKSQSSNGGAA
jgi:hypothetical protein